MLFIQTGGTIDKDYPKTDKGWAFEITDAAFERILEKLKPSFKYYTISLLKKDSLEITEDDRNKLAETINASSSSKIIITHGTDTMIDTAKYLSKNLKVNNKTIIITGAFRPERFSNSDAPINLGIAIGFAQSLFSGIYVSMNGLVKSWDKIKRDKITGSFI